MSKHLDELEKKLRGDVAVESRKGKPICPQCRYRIRGPNHEEGQHHKQGGRVGRSKTKHRWRK